MRSQVEEDVEVRSDGPYLPWLAGAGFLVGLGLLATGHEVLSAVWGLGGGALLALGLNWVLRGRRKP